MRGCARGTRRELLVALLLAQLLGSSRLAWSSALPRVVLHVGPHKTASSYVQARLCGRRAVRLGHVLHATATTACHCTPAGRVTRADEAPWPYVQGLTDPTPSHAMHPVCEHRAITVVSSVPFLPGVQSAVCKHEDHLRQNGWVLPLCAKCGQEQCGQKVRHSSFASTSYHRAAETRHADCGKAHVFGTRVTLSGMTCWRARGGITDGERTGPSVRTLADLVGHARSAPTLPGGRIQRTGCPEPGAIAQPLPTHASRCPCPTEFAQSFAPLAWQLADGVHPLTTR